MRFLQVSQARSGTHMLRAVFMTHPDVTAWWDYMGATAHIPGRLPDFLQEAYAKVPPDQTTGVMTHFGGVPVVGEPWCTHWRRLRTIHDRVIVLTRNNHLRRLLSEKLVKRADRERGESDENPNPKRRARIASVKPREGPPAPVQLGLQEYLHYTKLYQESVIIINRLLIPYYPVIYEDLCVDWSGTMRGVYDYLGLKWNNPQLITCRQETRPVRQIIINWKELITKAEAMLPNPAAERLLIEASEEI